MLRRPTAQPPSPPPCPCTSPGTNASNAKSPPCMRSQRGRLFEGCLAAAHEAATTNIRGLPSVSTSAAHDRSRLIVPRTSRPREGMFVVTARGSGWVRRGERQSDGRQDGRRRRACAGDRTHGEGGGGGGGRARREGRQGGCREAGTAILQVLDGGRGNDGGGWRGGTPKGRLHALRRMSTTLV